MTDRVRSHERRLRALFRRAVLLSLAGPTALQACSDDTIVGSTGSDAGDATVDEAASYDQAAGEAGGGMPEGGGGDAASDGSAVDEATDALMGTDAADAADAAMDAPLEASDAEAEASPPWCADASAGVPWWPDASGNCKYFVDLSCAQYQPVAGCHLNGTDCTKVCSLDASLFDCEYAQPACTVAGIFVAEGGQPVAVQCDLCPGPGRRPAGLRRPRRRRSAGSAVGEWFARAAYLEAASVLAFQRLELELRANRAPESLVAAARRSSFDEVRHAGVMHRMALRHGARPQRPRVAPSRPRSLERVARENAVEGCVRETYAALLATWQATRATDPGVRRCFARIAADETRHAALAWAVAEWAESRLDTVAHARLAHARRRALRRLGEELAAEPPRELAMSLGLPSARQAEALLGYLA